MDKKLLPLFICEILKDTDTHHRMHQAEILTKLKEKYQIEINRKTLSAYLTALWDYDIIDKHGKDGYCKWWDRKKKEK